MFFTCLDPKAGTPSALWLRRLKSGIKRFVFERSIAQGDRIDKSETPVYSLHVRELNKAYALEGSAEAATEDVEAAWYSDNQGMLSIVGASMKCNVCTA